MWLINGMSMQVYGQEGDVADLKNEILELRADVDHINMNLEKSRSKFQTGIFVATLGYSITIVGGVLLSNNEIETGRALIVTGGVTGGLGTFMLVDAFKFLGRKRKMN